MKTALIILNYNNFEDTINCIESVEKYNSSPVKIIVVDNGSYREKCVTSLDSYFMGKYKDDYRAFDYENDSPLSCLPYVSFVISKTNDGYARGNNKGLEYAYADSECEQVMILNNDILFIEDIIPGLTKRLEQQKDGAIISPLLLKKDQKSIDYNCARNAPTVWHIILPYIFFYQNCFGILNRIRLEKHILRKSPEKLSMDVVLIDLPSGSCMLLKKALMKNIGGFDPHTFLYYEENILYKKIKRIGKQSYIAPSLRCVHLGAASTKNSASGFTLTNAMKSSKYYIENYENPTLLEKLAMKIAYFNMGLKIQIIKRLKG